MTITYLVRFYTKTKLTLMSHMVFLALYKGNTLKQVLAMRFTTTQLPISTTLFLFNLA